MYGLPDFYIPLRFIFSVSQNSCFLKIIQLHQLPKAVVACTLTGAAGFLGYPGL